MFHLRQGKFKKVLGYGARVTRVQVIGNKYETYMKLLGENDQNTEA